MSKRTTVVLPDGLEDAIETLVRESYKREDVPDMSQSEVIRQLLTAGTEHSDLFDLIPEHELVAYRRQEIKQENKLRDWRAGFRTRVKRQFTRRFKNGYRPEELAEFSIGMRDEARILWHDDDDEEHVEKRREAIDYIDQVVDEARRSYEQSTHDPLDPEELFSSFSGVRNGETSEEIEEIALEDEVRRIINRIKLSQESGGKDLMPSKIGIDPEGITRRLANEHDLERDLVRQVVDEVLEDMEVTA